MFPRLAIPLAIAIHGGFAQASCHGRSIEVSEDGASTQEMERPSGTLVTTDSTSSATEPTSSVSTSSATDSTSSVTSGSTDTEIGSTGDAEEVERKEQAQACRSCVGGQLGDCRQALIDCASDQACDAIVLRCRLEGRCEPFDISDGDLPPSVGYPDPELSCEFYAWRNMLSCMDPLCITGPDGPCVPFYETC